jgi:hypothetical protein
MKWFPVMSEGRLIDIAFMDNKKLNPKILVEIAQADPENYYYNVEERILYGKIKVDEEYIKILCREDK